jgi:serine/threonine-protein kinase
VPERLGDFEIVGVLGEGGSSIVLSARGYGRDVALKVFQCDGPITDADRARFLSEAERMQRLSHSSLVTLLGAGFLPDGRPFIAMPRLRGETVAARATSPMPVARALPLFRGLVLAVAALHAAGLVHRDIKPENVFWLEEEDRLVLLDLGIAREVDASPSTTTRAGFARGTPAYMAPERLFGNAASIRSDLYELALVLVYMLLGRLPWEDGDPHARMLPNLSQLPPELVPVFERALSLDVERRPPSALQLLDWIESAIAASSSAPGRSHRPPPGSAGAPRGPAAQALLDAEPADLRARDALPREARTAPSPPTAWSSRAKAAVASVGLAVAAVVTGAVLWRASRSGDPVGSAPSAGPPTAAPDGAATSGRVASGPPAEASVAASASTAPPSGSSSATPSAPPSYPTGAPSSRGIDPVPSGGTSASASRPSVGAASSTIPECVGYVALMCDPTSGALPNECQAAKVNTSSWTAKFPREVAVETCRAARDNSKVGLAARREWKPP